MPKTSSYPRSADRRCFTMAAACALMACGNTGSPSTTQGTSTTASASTTTPGNPSCQAAAPGVDARAPACLTPSTGNLLPGPGFDTGANAWQGGGWSPIDATGCAASGSAEVPLPEEVEAGIGSSYTINNNCVSVTPGTKYDYGAMVRVPATPGVQVSVQVQWTDVANCNGGGSGPAALMADPSVSGSWQALGSSAVAPAGMNAAYLVLQVNSTGTAASALFDDVYLSECPGSF